MKKNILQQFIHYLFLVILLTGESTEENDEIFKTDIGDQMKIGLSDKGYKSVELKCGSNSMLIKLETEEQFDGVIYTRGNFYDKRSPCFLDPAKSISQQDNKTFSLKFSLDECNTKKNGEIFFNILVLQHDKELIMPGDVAFNLECDFNKPRSVTVHANLENENEVISRISLTDADPGFKETETYRKTRRSIESHTDTVILTKAFLNHQQHKEEL